MANPFSDQRSIVEERLPRWLFEGCARSLFNIMEPGRACFATTLAVDAGWSEDMVRWTLGNLASIRLVERRGSWWRLTEWGERAKAGEAPPENWPASDEERQS